MSLWWDLNGLQVDPIKQAPVEGTSFAYTFDKANEDTPSRHTTQYFEMMGQWALYREGWLLNTKVDRAPWDALGPASTDPLNNQILLTGMTHNHPALGNRQDTGFTRHAPNENYCFNGR